MKVCFVTTSFVRSSSDHYARFVYEQAKSLRRAEPETEVVVVVPHAPGSPCRETMDGIEIRRVRYFWPTRWQRLAYQHEGLFATLKRSPLALLQLPLLLSALLVELFQASKGAELLHAQWVPTAPVAIAVGWMRRLPVVVSVRGADLNSARRSRLGRTMLRIIVERVRHVVTVSEEFRGFLMDEIGCGRPVSTIYNGVDLEQFRPRDKVYCREVLGLATEGLMALYVGGLIERKGVDLPIRSLGHDRLRHRGITLHVAGEGPLRDELEELASAQGLGGRVKFHGKIVRDQVGLWVAAADMLVLPSYSEGLPNVVLEGMATGTPVVATAVNGTAEVIRDGESGLLFSPGSVGELVSCLERLIDDPELVIGLSQGGRERIAALGLTWSRHGRALLSIYRTALETS